MNRNTRRKVKVWLKRHPRFHLHVPTSKSLAQPGRTLGPRPDEQANLMQSFLVSHRFTIQAYIQSHDQKYQTPAWTAKAEDIIAKYRRAKARPGTARGLKILVPALPKSTENRNISSHICVATRGQHNNAGSILGASQATRS